MLGISFSMEVNWIYNTKYVILGTSTGACSSLVLFLM